MKHELKDERTIIPAPIGTRIVHVDEYKVRLGENVVAFSYSPEYVLLCITTLGTLSIPGLIDKEGYSNEAYGVYFPNGTIDSDCVSYENIEELQDYLNRLNPELKKERSHD